MLRSNPQTWRCPVRLGCSGPQGRRCVGWEKQLALVGQEPVGRAARRFEELRVWQQARLLVRAVYSDFESAPRDYSFRDQIQRAALSIMNNIAEGFERASPKEFSRFLEIAKSSCGEVRSMYYVAQDIRYITIECAQLRRQHAAGIAQGIEAFRKHLVRQSARRGNTES